MDTDRRSSWGSSALAAPPPPPVDSVVVVDDAPATPSPVVREGRARPPWWWLALLVVVALVAGATAGAIAGHSQQPNTSTSTSSTSPTTTTAAPGSLAELATLMGIADVPTIAASIRPSVVAIVATSTTSSGPFGRTSTQESQGTGFVLTESGQIATNNHVISGATSIVVTFSDGTQETATIVGASATDDLALLHVNRTNLTPVPLGASQDLRVGETVVAIGNALALPGGPTVTMGIVSALGRSITVSSVTYSDLIQTDAAISSGNSGGPLLDHEGKVVGINSAAATASSSSSAENIGFAISLAHAIPVLRSLGANV